MFQSLKWVDKQGARWINCISLRITNLPIGSQYSSAGFFRYGHQLRAAETSSHRVTRRLAAVSSRDGRRGDGLPIFDNVAAEPARILRV
jgi:hypothetical protein